MVEVDAQTLPVEAIEVIGAERDDLWRRPIVLRPGLADTKPERVGSLSRSIGSRVRRIRG
jgi:hypothetical protein